MSNPTRGRQAGTSSPTSRLQRDRAPHRPGSHVGAALVARNALYARPSRTTAQACRPLPRLGVRRRGRDAGRPWRALRGARRQVPRSPRTTSARPAASTRRRRRASRPQRRAGPPPHAPPGQYPIRTAITDFGIERVDLVGGYSIDKERIDDPDWDRHVTSKQWVDVGSFRKALETARAWKSRGLI
jgi:hypothetical protein